MSDPGQEIETGLPSWDELAPWWKATFTHGADLEYEQQILPLVDGAPGGPAPRPRPRHWRGAAGAPARRRRTDTGAIVVGLDSSSRHSSPTPGPKAAARSGCRRSARALPFAAESFDAVVCCLVIEHAADADALLAEVARVLARGGGFSCSINHPIVQGPGSGLVDDAILGERYWRVGPYLPETRNVEQVDSGVHVAFAHRPLSRYINPLAELGLFLVRIEEPEPPLRVPLRLDRHGARAGDAPPLRHGLRAALSWSGA